MGSNPTPGTLDPVTGLSSRTLRLLVVVIVVGVVVSTAATIGGAEPGCPDARYGCATYREAEAVIVGVLVTSDMDAEDVTAEVRAAIDARGGQLEGRPLRPFVWRAPCSAEGGAEGARELATDPLDAPPAFAIAAVACDTAVRPAAQILADSGIALVTTTPPPPLAHNSWTTLDGSAMARSEGLGSVIGTILDGARELARLHDGDLLIPRTPLLRHLQMTGLDAVRRA